MTIFEKIINWEIPSYKIYEDEYVYAFLDIKPHTLWHTLVVPKVAIGDYRDVPEPYYSACFNAAKKLGDAIQKATNCQRPWMIVHGLWVPDHFHLHIVPIHTIDDLDSHKAHEESSDAMKDIQQKIIDQLSQK